MQFSRSPRPEDELCRTRNDEGRTTMRKIQTLTQISWEVGEVLEPRHRKQETPTSSNAKPPLSPTRSQVTPDSGFEVLVFHRTTGERSSFITPYNSD